MLHRYIIQFLEYCNWPFLLKAKKRYHVAGVGESTPELAFLTFNWLRSGLII